MARIPDGEIERLKREVSLERLVVGAGVELKRHGADLIGLCPFHDDHDPSLVVSSKKNLWHCLGACSAGGSVIDWVMRAEGVSFRHLSRRREDPMQDRRVAVACGGDLVAEERSCGDGRIVTLCFWVDSSMAFEWR